MRRPLQQRVMSNHTHTRRWLTDNYLFCIRGLFCVGTKKKLKSSFMDEKYTNTHAHTVEMIIFNARNFILIFIAFYLFLIILDVDDNWNMRIKHKKTLLSFFIMVVRLNIDGRPRYTHYNTTHPHKTQTIEKKGCRKKNVFYVMTRDRRRIYARRPNLCANKTGGGDAHENCKELFVSAIWRRIGLNARVCTTQQLTTRVRSHCCRLWSMHIWYE